MRFFTIIVFGLVFFSANAATPTHIQAAERVFDLLTPSSHIKKIYGPDTKFPRPTTDVFFTAYRTTFVKELAARHPEFELTSIADRLAEQVDIDASLLEVLNQPQAISLQNAIEKLAAVSNPEDGAKVLSIKHHAKNEEKR